MATTQPAIICSGDEGVVDVITTLVTAKTRFKWSASYGAVTGGAGSATSVAFGPGAINDGPLTNGTNGNVQVAYTITPYTFGPNQLDNGGLGDDCVESFFDVYVTVEPAPAATATAQPAIICSGDKGVVDVTTTLLVPTKFKWSASS